MSSTPSSLSFHPPTSPDPSPSVTLSCSYSLSPHLLLSPHLQGINFPEFTLHLFLGIILAMVAAYGLLSLTYYFSFIRVKNKDPPHISELKREVAIWERTAQRLNVVSLEERAVRDAILAKAMDVRNQLSQEVNVTMHSSKDLWQKNLTELESKYRITNWPLLIKSSAVLGVVILMFFLSNLIPKVELEIGKSLSASSGRKLNITATCILNIERECK